MFVVLLFNSVHLPKRESLIVPRPPPCCCDGPFPRPRPPLPMDDKDAKLLLREEEEEVGEEEEEEKARIFLNHAMGVIIGVVLVVLVGWSV